ncbi:Arc family DNA-binding protein [Duganella levis]|uniref:Arc family DNA-binding protein n=1 Tax=Duganella levis TaxID=2692169 RepID=A0ABW9VUZ9_9BURK|nr:Arc family DNA-binding protein [Duganella levis]MYN25461.1 Arc family DNA-binding protein [Duganella levis]
MSDIYRSQFRMPISLFEKLKTEAGKSKRSANAELVARLERSLADSSNELDLRLIFEALERLSLRNPAMRYSFGVNLGGKLDERPAEIAGGKWLLRQEPGDALKSQAEKHDSLDPMSLDKGAQARTG